MKKLFGSTILLFLVAGCASFQLESTSTPSPMPPTETPTFTLTPTFTPTNTPSPTPTPTPIKLPVLNGTPVPLSNIPISLDNADKVTELARYWGNPDTYVDISTDSKTLAMATTEDIYIFDIPSGGLLANLGAHIYINHLNGYQPLSDADSSQMLSISADGSLLAYVDEMLTTHVYDFLSGKEVFSIDQLRPGYISISPDGNTLAIAAGDLYVYDIATWQRLSPQASGVSRICFSDRGKYMVFGQNNTVMVYSTVDWQKVSSFTRNQWPNITCDPLSSRIAIRDVPEIEILDVITGRSIAKLNAARSPFSGWDGGGLQFSQDGKEIIVMNTGESVYDNVTIAELLDIKTGQSLDRIVSFKPAVFTIKRLSVSNDNKLEMITTGINAQGLPSYGSWCGADYIKVFQFLDGSRGKLAVSAQGGIFTCEVTLTGTVSCPVITRWGGAGQVMVVDGDYYNSPIVQGQKTAVLFKGLNNIGMPITEIQPRTSSVDYAYMMSYSKLYNASLVEVIDQTNDRRLYLFDQETNKALHDWKSQHLGCPSTGYDLVSSPDQKYFAIITRRDNTSYQLCVFDLSTKELVINKILRDDFISYGFQINFSPDSHTVAVLASERQILFNKDRSVRFALHIINIDASKSVEFQIELPEPTPVTFAYTTKESNITVSALTFTPDSSLMAVGTYDGRILLIDTLDGSILDVIQAHVEPILSVAFNSDGSLLSSMGRSSILKFWGIAPQ